MTVTSLQSSSDLCNAFTSRFRSNTMELEPCFIICLLNVQENFYALFAFSEQSEPIMKGVPVYMFCSNTVQTNLVR
jgi:hypothetical protein